MRRAVAVRELEEGAAGAERERAFAPGELLPIADSPETIHIAVIGGAGKHSAWMPSWGRTTRPVTVPLTTREGRPIARVQELRS
jgi:hypothetical protein